MYCQACNLQNVADASFCRQCGTALSPYAPPQAVVAGVPQVLAWAGYAGFWKRFAAVLIDTLITAAIGGVLGAVWGAFYGATHPLDPITGAKIGGGIIGGVAGWLYFVIMESSASQATLGKMALGIMVTDTEGHRISFARANGRYFGKFISSLLLLIGYLMAAFTEKKQALHDIMASCLVVNKA